MAQRLVEVTWKVLPLEHGSPSTATQPPASGAGSILQAKTGIT